MTAEACSNETLPSLPRPSLTTVVAALRGRAPSSHGREELRRSEIESLRAELEAGSRKRLQETADAIPEAISRWSAIRDGDGRAGDFVLSFANAAGNRLLAELAGPVWLREHARVSTMGQVGERAFGLLRQALDSREPVVREFGGTPGLRRHIATYAAVQGADAVVVTSRDIHDRWLAERALAAAEARARALVEQSPAATIVLDESLVVSQANDAAAVLLGRPREDVEGREISAVLGLASRTSLSALLASLGLPEAAGSDAAGSGLGLETPSSYQLELAYTRLDGQDRLLRLTVGVAGSPGADLSLVGHLRDVTDEASAAARLQHEATHDALTSLPNRWLVMARLRQALEAWSAGLPENQPDPALLLPSQRCSPEAAAVGQTEDGDDEAETGTEAETGPEAEAVDEALCVIFVDLDCLKSVNDSWGHAAGDELLVDAARRICASVRPHDTVARLAGDEFVVLLDEPLSEMAARRVAGRVRRALGQPFVLAQGASTTGASVGVALSRSSDTPESLLARADSAMYADKMARRALRTA